MSDAETGSQTGRCLCGGITFTVTGPLRDVIDCHCHRCRRWTGHHMAATSAEVSEIRLEGEDLLEWYFPVEEASYGFCRGCGSSLFWRASDNPGWWSICAGTLDPPTHLTTTVALWVSEASDYHTRAELIERQTE
jgi:hypothetical protein